MPHEIKKFIQRWQKADGSERANYQLFLTELCEAIALPRPEPASKETEDNAYVFERKVIFRAADGSESPNYIDLYKRNCFVLEAKQTGKELESQSWDTAMRKAHAQAQQYARSLPTSEGRPPFLIVTDVGRSIELFSEFTRSGGNYVPFRDPLSYRIRVEDLDNEETRDTLRSIWTDPLSLDPARRSAEVTKVIARDLAKLAESLEKAGHTPEAVAAFLMRCLFTMFAEDVGLLPKRSFTRLLEETRGQPELFSRLMPGLWKAMNEGGFSAEVRGDVLRFNGGLFAEQRALPLEKAQIDLLLQAARADWRHVEPAIFGTLLERALDPVERHKLGAHYTPRSYVERLVMPTVIEPLREEWMATQAAALTLDRQGKRDNAVKEIHAFHDRLCAIRVLDPACGSGNFLYVTLEHLKRLEGEVFNALDELGYTQARLEMAGSTVDPHQMLGLETNPRAARIAEAVIWIGYLQWHFRTRGNVHPPTPVLKDFHNIECRDAVLAWDRVEYQTDERGIPVTRWDGRTSKQHPVTGEQVPDEEAQVPLERYVNPRKAEWPEADFVIGNPPYLGARRIRLALGHDYLTALRNVYGDVPAHADYVMYWWDKAASLVRAGRLRRLGFITTNSIRQSFSKKVLEKHMSAKKPLSIAFAIPDHPWVDSADGAAVRVAMTVGAKNVADGILAEVVAERPGEEGERAVELRSRRGIITTGLRVGVNLSRLAKLDAKNSISSVGYQLTGRGFVVDKAEAGTLDPYFGSPESIIRRLLSGRDITQIDRELLAIDAFGLTEERLRSDYPSVYQWLLDRVRPERELNRDGPSQKQWWVFARPRPGLRSSLSGLQTCLVTSLTSKHRFFVRVSAQSICDSSTVMFALEDPFHLGVLSSRPHVVWVLAVGGRLGVGNDPRYNKSRCFETFPFPEGGVEAGRRIRNLAEQIQAHRSRQQGLHSGLTLTKLYNVLEKLRTGDKLSETERRTHDQGLVSVLSELHNELDAAVLDCYGWPDLATDLVGKPGGLTPCLAKSEEHEQAEEELLRRLANLNAVRKREESRGVIRWLRPEFQNPEGAAAEQELLEGVAAKTQPAAAPRGKLAWPKNLSDQVQAVRAALEEQAGPLVAEDLARLFKRAQRSRVTEILETLSALGQARADDDGRFAAA